MSGNTTQTQLLFVFHRFPHTSLATALHLSSMDAPFVELTNALETLVNSHLLSRTRSSRFAPWTFCVTESGATLCTDVETMTTTESEIVRKHRNEEARAAALQQKVADFLQRIAPFGVPMIVIEDFLYKQHTPEVDAAKTLASLSASGIVQNTCNGLLWCAKTNQ